MDSQIAFQRYQDLQKYVSWEVEDVSRVRQAYAVVASEFPKIVDDFYAEIERHPEALQVITEGDAQISRLKRTLLQWLEELFSGNYDEAYVARRMKVGQRHVAIGLDQVYASAAFSRLRWRLETALAANWRGSDVELRSISIALQKLLDLDLALVVDAYETEHIERHQLAERQRVEGELHQEREFSAGLLSYAPVIVVVLDERGFYVRGNPFFVELVGTTAEKAVGRDWFSAFFAPADCDRLRTEFLSPGATTDSSDIFSTLMSRAGQTRQVRWAVTNLRDAVGQTFAHLVIGHDVTELHAAQERALQAQRLAAIGQMATGLAHESRNALQRIQACAELLELELAGNATALNLVGRIQNAQGHIEQLLEEVRGYAAPVKLDRGWCRMSDIWREAWDTLSPQRKGRVANLCEIVCDIDLRALVDRFRMVQVFRNLFENSLAAANDPVEITVLVDHHSHAGEEFILITVRDNGPGMKPDERRRAFEPFFTTKPKGTGLGMAIAQRIVDAHGGTIQIVDRPPPGAEIVIELPRGEI